MLQVAFPDVLRIPDVLKRGKTQADRLDYVIALARKHMGLDKKTKVYIIPFPDNQPCFVSTKNGDLLYHPYGHPKQGKPRYRWERRLISVDNEIYQIDAGFLIDPEDNFVYDYKEVIKKNNVVLSTGEIF